MVTQNDENRVLVKWMRLRPPEEIADRPVSIANRVSITPRKIEGAD